jgi:chromosome segregation ATPase
VQHSGKISSLEKDKLGLQIKLDTAERTIEDDRRSAESVEQQLGGELRVSKQINEDLVKERDEARRQRDSAIDVHRSCSSDVKSFERQLLHQKQDAAIEKQDAVNDLNSKLESLRLKLERKEGAVSEFNEAVTRLEAAHQSTIEGQTSKVIAAQTKGFNASQDACKELINSLEKRVTSLEEDLLEARRKASAELERERQTLQAESDDRAAASATAYEKSLGDWSEKLQNKTIDANRLEQALNAEKDSHKQTRSTLERAQQDLAAEEQAHGKTSSRSSSETAKLETASNALRREQDAHKTTKATLQNEVKTVRQDLKDEQLVRQQCEEECRKQTGIKTTVMNLFVRIGGSYKHARNDPLRRDLEWITREIDVICRWTRAVYPILSDAFDADEDTWRMECVDEWSERMELVMTAYDDMNNVVQPRLGLQSLRPGATPK